MKNKFIVLNLLLIVIVFTGCKDGSETKSEWLGKRKGSSIVIDAPKRSNSYLVYFDRPFPSHYRGPLSSKVLPVHLSAHLTFKGGGSGKIVWRSSKDGYLGVGNELNASLSKGRHEISAVYAESTVLNRDTIVIKVKETPSHLFKDIEEKKNRRLRKVKDQEGDVLIVDIDKGLITDTSTQLMWMKCPEYYKYTYYEAVKYARNCELAGYSDWRLPTYRELRDISNLDNQQAIIHRTFDCYENRFWTCTICKSESNEKVKYFSVIRYTEYGTHNNAFFATRSLAHSKERLRARLVRDVH